MSQNHQRLAINDTKQAELDTLSAAVTRTEYKVEQLQAIVTSLTDKRSYFDTVLATSETSRNNALSNFNLVKEVVVGIEEMVRKANTVCLQTNLANHKINEASTNMSKLIEQLIFSVEVIDKLAMLINKKQASKVLISEELVTTVNTAASDANSAIALTLTALNSCYTATATCAEADYITVLEKSQSLRLYGQVTGRTKVSNKCIATSKALALAETELEQAQSEVNESGNNLINAGVVSSKKQLEKDVATLTAKAKANQSNIDAQLTPEKLKDATLDKIVELRTLKSEADRLVNMLVSFTDAQSSLETATTNYNQAKADNDSAMLALEQEFLNKNPAIQDERALYCLLDKANTAADDKYKFDQQVVRMVNQELIQAEANLVSATVELNSLKAGLAAATAAALAA